MNSSRKRFPTDQHGWAELLPERKSPAPQTALSGKQRAAFVVVGAGVTGLACARRLAQLHPDEEILLLEARLVGQGSSGRNSGYAVETSVFPGGFKANQVSSYKRINRLNKAGLELLRQQVSEHSLDCQWNDTGYHYTAADKGSLTQYGHFLTYLDRLEIDHTIIEKDDLHKRLGTAHYLAGVHVPGGALMQPAALVRGLADHLPDNVTLHEQTPVLGISKGSPAIIQLENAEISADKVFLATNYEAAKIGFLARYLIGSTLSGSLTRVLTKQERDSLGSLDEWGVLSLHMGGATVRLTSDNRICLRNTAEYHGGDLLSETELAERARIHRESFDRRFPQLIDVPFEYSWSGVEGISQNGTNFFGRQRDNIFLAGGFNGAGVSRGTAFGTALAEYAGGGQSDLITDCLACPPAKWLPPRPLLDIGAAFTVATRFRGVGQDR